MPTAAKLVALLAFAAVGFFAAEIFKPGFDIATRWGWFTSVSAFIGAILGWRIAGAEAGRGWGNAVSSGLRTAALMLFAGLVIFSVERMIARSMTHQYKGIFDAILGTFDIMWLYGSAFFTPQPMSALFIGGILAALLTEWTQRQSN